jgi:hypothetical protein
VDGWGFRVCSGFRVWGLWFEVWGPGLRVKILGFMVHYLEIRVWE